MRKPLYALFFVAVAIAALIAACVSSQPTSAVAPNQEFIREAAGIFQNPNPSEEEIAWIDSLTEEQLVEVIDWIKANIPVDSLIQMNTDKCADIQTALSSCSGNWKYEWIETRSGVGYGCYSDGFTNDWDHRCGGDFPPDKVYFFPCSNYNNPGSMRIYSSDWRSRAVLKSGVSARVYPGCVQVCVGYWSLVYTFTNPYTFMNSTYVYW